MKKLLIVALALFALHVNAQDNQETVKELRKRKMEQRKNMDPQEMAKLQTKKMTLDLDLTQEQQNKVEKINVKNAKFRKARKEKRMALKDVDKKLTPEEKLEAANARLDHQIATKREMKKILTQEQYEKYSKMFQRMQTKGKHRKMKGEKRAKKEHKITEE